MRCGSLRPYVASIGYQNRSYGLEDPTKDPLVVSTKQGYLENDATRADGHPERSAPFRLSVNYDPCS